MGARITSATRRFRRNREGATAVEFALILPLFLAMVFSTMEAGWLMLQSIMLDQALDRTIRELRIGALVNPTQQSVRAEVCTRARILVSCTTSLALQFIPIKSEADYPTEAAPCIDRNIVIQPVIKFDPGARNDTVFVRACFVVDPLIPMMGAGMGLPTDKNGEHRLIAYAAFANEP